ncbi:hypothetical protein [Tenacibaculum sp. SDUM215027]
MTPNIKKLFSELEKYEKEGTDSMDWVEYAHQAIDKDIIKNLDEKD